jgi:hypothetical protein
LNEVRGADAVTLGGRPHRLRRYRESLLDPARSKPVSTALVAEFCPLCT